MPKFSIVMPVFNLEKWVGEAVESVLSQSFGDWELICVDDGSTDGSSLILDDYSARDGRIRVIHQANEGEGAARNTALAIAKGEWLAYLDGDDIWHPDFLSTALNGMSQFPSAQIVRVAHMDFVDGSEWKWAQANAEFRFLDFSRSITRDTYKGGFLDCVYLRSAVADVRFKDYPVGVDRACFSDCIAKMSCMAATEAVRYAYRLRPGSAIRSAETARKSIAQVAWQMDQMRFWEHCGRNVDRAMARWAVQSLVEWHAYFLYRLPRSELPSAWDSWHAAIAELRRFRLVPCWYKVVCWLVTLFPLRITAWILCAFPHWLKRKGVHR